MSKVVTCCVCGEVITGARYALGYSLVGWPQRVPETVYCHAGECKAKALAAEAARLAAREGRQMRLLKEAA